MKTFSRREAPEEIEEYHLKAGETRLLADILVETKAAVSKNEVRRLLKQGAIKFNGERLSGEDWAPKAGILKIGKRRFLRLVEGH